MYPTMNSLMDLRQFLIAHEVRVEHCKPEVQQFLRKLTSGKLFCQATWKCSPAFVRLIPHGDLLPRTAEMLPRLFTRLRRFAREATGGNMYGFTTPQKLLDW